MSGLVAYNSSDEETEDVAVTNRNANNPTNEHSPLNDSRPLASTEINASNGTSLHDLPNHDRQKHPSHVDPPGPSIGPSRDVTVRMNDDDGEMGGASSRESRRSALHNITMPEFPNLEIPPSPPGSPTPGVDAKVAQLLRLKADGVHFNSKLAAASALKNPAILPKLMQAAGLDDAVQYTTTLPLTPPSRESLPPYAFPDELDKAQKEFSEENAAASVGNPRRFVPATASSKRN